MDATEEVRELRARLAEMQGEMARMAERLAHLDGQPAEPAAVASAPPPTVEEGISEDVVLVLAAAIAAYLGKRAHIRQIRLLGSAPWAQQGRVSIQASHRLDGGTGW
jgi:methylmalonyl-CoA carboxyltransferase 12S subunit